MKKLLLMFLSMFCFADTLDDFFSESYGYYPYTIKQNVILKVYNNNEVIANLVLMPKVEVELLGCYGHGCIKLREIERRLRVDGYIDSNVLADRRNEPLPSYPTGNWFIFDLMNAIKQSYHNVTVKAFNTFDDKEIEFKKYEKKEKK